MPKKLRQEDCLSWCLLADRWEISDRDLWYFFEKEKISLYRQAKNSMRLAGNSIRLKDVKDLWIKQVDAVILEWNYWRKVKAYLAGYVEGMSRAPQWQDVSPIKVPKHFAQLLKMPTNPDRQDIVLTRSAPQTEKKICEGKTKSRQPLPTTLDRELFRKEAKQSWLSGSKRNTSKMANELIKRLSGKIKRKKMYNPKAVCDWIRDLNPDPKPGNPGKAKKNNVT